MSSPPGCGIQVIWELGNTSLNVSADTWGLWDPGRAALPPSAWLLSCKMGRSATPSLGRCDEMPGMMPSANLRGHKGSFCYQRPPHPDLAGPLPPGSLCSALQQGHWSVGACLEEGLQTSRGGNLRSQQMRPRSSDAQNGGTDQVEQGKFEGCCKEANSSMISRNTAHGAKPSWCRAVNPGGGTMPRLTSL